MTTINGLALPKLSNHQADASSAHRTVGPALAFLGLGIVVFTAIVNWASISDVGIDPGSVAVTTLWAGGVGVAGLAVIKIAIAVVLVGIILRLWNRVDSIKATLPQLRVRESAPPVPLVRAPTVTSDGVPKSLRIHIVATRMWKPMLVMGSMAVAAGTVIRIAAIGETGGTETFRQLAAWGAGTEFLGEALVLSGISFLLATILASLRQGGSEVQAAVGAEVTVLKMPGTAKAFVMLMMIGLMTGIAQFVASIVLAGRANDAASFGELAAFVGPLREFSLGVILAGIVLALATISTVLSFQFIRVRELARLN